MPSDWENLTLSEQELDALCDAVDAGKDALAISIVDGACARLEGCEYELRCNCGMRHTIRVSNFVEVYRVMNELGWGLIPSQHDRIVAAVCPVCRVKSSPSYLRKLVVVLRTNARREGLL